MSDTAAMLEQFAKYTHMIESDGRKPTNEDIDFFLKHFFESLKYGFPFKGIFIYTAGKILEDGRPLYDVQGKSYAELIAEAKPVLESKVLELYSKIGESIESFEWDTIPRSVDDYAKMFSIESGTAYDSLIGTEKRNSESFQKAVGHANKISFRIKTYFKEILPFMMRHTMFHEIGTVGFDAQSGESTLTTFEESKSHPFRIKGEEDLQRFLDNEQLGNMIAGQNRNLRSIFWTPSSTGKNIKLGIVDIDNPANLPNETLVKATKKIHKILSNQRHPSIIMFTGSSYHIWFGPNDEDLGDSREVNEYLRGMLGGVGAFDKEEAIDLKLPFIDLSVNRPGGQARMFFSLHYPPSLKSKPNKTYTGLAAIPVTPSDLDKFDPVADAHPERVRANFQAYSSYISKFFDLIGVGQEHESPEDLESPPSCSKLAEKKPKHTLLKHLYNREQINNIQYRNILSQLEGESKVIAYSQPRGLGAVFVYDPTGTSGPSGMTSTRILHGKAVTSPASAYYITRQGTVVYDDYLCRELERYCEARKIRSVILSGHIVVSGNLRGERDRQAAISILNRKPLSALDCRKLRFVISKINILNGEEVPMEIMPEQIKEFHTTRIQGVTYFELAGNIGEKIKQIFMDLQKQRKSGSMIIEGSEKYLLTSTRTINLAVMGMKKGKAFMSNEAPPVYVAAATRSSKHGVIYHIVGLAQIALPKDERIKLRELIDGENGRNVLPVDERFENDMTFAEPAVVVEVSYDDISPQFRHTFAHAYSKNKFRPIVKPIYGSNSLVNAKVIAIREDLNVSRGNDISNRQDDLLEITSKPINKGASLLDVLPNPPKLPEFVRRNSAFFGVPETLETHVGGWYSEKDQSVVGGRKIQLPLVTEGPRYRGERLPGEMQKAFERFHRGEEGYKIYVEPRSLVRSSDPKYYRVTNLGGEFQIAKDDQRGSGADGNLVTSMNSEITQQNNFGAMVADYDLSNKEQAVEDTKVVGTMLMDNYSNIWHDPASEEPTYRHEDQKYIEDYKKLNKELKGSLKATALDSRAFNSRTEGVMENPQPIKADAWEHRIDKHVEDYRKWEERPQPKISWEMYFRGLGSSWEIPLLEKERLLRIAREEHGLSDAEVEQIDMNYSEVNFDALSESILANLYEVPQDDGDEV